MEPTLGMIFFVRCGNPHKLDMCMLHCCMLNIYAKFSFIHIYVGRKPGENIENRGRFRLYISFGRVDIGNSVGIL